MRIKTNIRAGQGGVDSSATDTSVDTSTSSSKQKQNGKTTTTVVYTSRCTGY
jgi:hypothetical protein